MISSFLEKQLKHKDSHNQIIFFFVQNFRSLIKCQRDLHVCLCECVLCVCACVVCVRVCYVCVCCACVCVWVVLHWAVAFTWLQLRFFLSRVCFSVRLPKSRLIEHTVFQLFLFLFLILKSHFTFEVEHFLCDFVLFFNQLFKRPSPKATISVKYYSETRIMLSAV